MFVMALPKNANRSWIQSVQGAIATWSNDRSQDSLGYRMLITDQVAIAPVLTVFKADVRLLSDAS